jgi:transposase-like protein
MTEYTEGFRARMVERMTGPRAVSANALSLEVGITQPTLSRWLREAGTVAGVAKKKSKSKPKPKAPSPAAPAPGQWSAEEKVRVVLAAAGVSEQGLGEFLRREGLHEQDLERFREEVRSAAIVGLTPQKKAARGDEQKRIKDLERELKRKEAALAEAAALLVLRKKAGALWGGEGEDT